MPHDLPAPLTRRQLLRQCCAGFGNLTLGIRKIALVASVMSWPFLPALLVKPGAGSGDHGVGASLPGERGDADLIVGQGNEINGVDGDARARNFPETPKHLNEKKRTMLWFATGSDTGSRSKQSA